MITKTISSGFVVRSKDGRYLLGKSEGHSGPCCWTIFKGGQEGEETLIDTAIRELKEETGIDVINDHRLNKNISTNPIYEYSLRHKDVYLFILDDVEGVLDTFPFSCSSFWSDGKPEIMAYKWCTIEEMKEHIFYSQRGLIDKLESMWRK